MIHKATISALVLGFAVPGALVAQTIMDVSQLRDMEDIDIHTADGEDIGEVEAVLVDRDGTPVAVSVEVGGFLGIGDTDRVIPLDRLTPQGDIYVLDATRDELEQMPEWDD